MINSNIFQSTGDADGFTTTLFVDAGPELFDINPEYDCDTVLFDPDTDGEKRTDDARDVTAPDEFPEFTVPPVVASDDAPTTVLPFVPNIRTDDAANAVPPSIHTTLVKTNE